MVIFALIPSSGTRKLGIGSFVCSNLFLGNVLCLYSVAKLIFQSSPWECSASVAKPILLQRYPVTLVCVYHTFMDSNEVDNGHFAFESESMEEECDAETQVENTGGDTGKEKNVVQSKPSHKRKETSKVWKVFVKLPRGNMIRHMESCTKLANNDIRQMLLNKGSQGDMVVSNRRDPQVVRDIISAAIVTHGLPFKFVEWSWIRRLIEYLCDDVTLVSRNTAKADVVKLFSREKQKIKTMLENTPGRICLTCDLWTSINTDGFLCLTAHFLDRNWVLQKKVLIFCIMLPPHDGVSLAHKINTLLCEWGIEKKIFSITLDNASSNKSFVDLLRSQLNLKKALVCNGEFLHIRCCAHIVNLIVQDGLKEIDEVVLKIRECIRYIRGSQARKQTFLGCCKNVFLDSKMGLKQDVPTRWNSTYLMLQSAIYYRRAWCSLELSDNNFKHCPCPSEWEKVQKITSFLQYFYDITCVFSGTKYPTSNLFFPKVFSTYMFLKLNMDNSDEFLKKMAIQMYKKYYKYWGEFSVILAIALVLDPRYKMTFVEFAYKKVYGIDSPELDNVRNKLLSLVNEYMLTSMSTRESTSTTLPSSSRGGDTITDMGGDIFATDIMQEYEAYNQQEDSNVCNQKSQLEMYLDEPKLEMSSNLDVLDYWKVNTVRYPDLSVMARDILSIPISTVASEVAFSVGGRVLDRYRSLLKPDVVEAIVCTRDWMQGESVSEALEVDDIAEDILKLTLENSPGPSVESATSQFGD
ncbi:hypothetical protein Dsin_005031 [Dipteronia sinensis]|uniref:Zinc finger BED domain-containing protein RICESLEEPER 2-like n=1 Tax=Dipteronia sinensis TaxID=43782 RepID=A0AAE0AX48_9ROSI|nr:hypothetical protein Dsin_005031 [Dipteronia sinensis]